VQIAKRKFAFQVYGFFGSNDGTCTITILSFMWPIKPARVEESRTAPTRVPWKPSDIAAGNHCFLQAVANG
jgi:hypothetical protein